MNEYKYWGTSEKIEELKKRGVEVDSSFGENELNELLIKTEK
jgi:hypothetical protein